MKNKKLLVILGTICLVLIVGLASFGSACAPADREKVEINMLSRSEGGISYIMSFALCDLVNKYSDRITMTNVETKGPFENLSRLMNNPEVRGNTVVYSQETEVSEAYLGWPPFEAKFPAGELKIVGGQAFPTGGFTFMVYDPNIKTVTDLKGKIVGTASKGSGPAVICDLILQEFGVADQVEVSNVGSPKAKAALINGVADAFFGPPGSANALNALSAEIMAAKPTYLIYFTKEIGESIIKKHGLWLSYRHIPKDQFGEGLPMSPGGALSGKNSWWAHESMDDDIVYEITKIFWEHADELKNYHAIGEQITHEMIPDIREEKDFHPGALKFFKEQGIQVGAR